MQNLRGAASRVSLARETTFQPARSQLGGAGEPLVMVSFPGSI